MKAIYAIFRSVRQRRLLLASAVAAAIFGLATSSKSDADDNPPDQDGTVHVSAFSLPASSLVDESTRTALKQARALAEGVDAEISKTCPSSENVGRQQMAATRRCEAKAMYRTAFYREFRKLYSVEITSQTMGGVLTEVFTPRSGVAPQNKDRVLVNLHGGHFKIGSRTISHLESLPIASRGQIRVISVDYRMAPEDTFPAASEDVAAVYRELLRSHRPQKIGLFGCSAGSLLTAEAIAWFQKEGLPLPGAIGMFGGGASYYQEGDSGQLSAAMSGVQLERAAQHPYFRGTDRANPLAFPILSQQIMARFPPSLLIATTRDIGESAAVYTHSQLVKLGVDAELHIWEGMDHCFFAGFNVPAADEVHQVIVRFFDRHLRDK
jgi:acetyl esterase/lipase